MVGLGSNLVESMGSAIKRFLVYHLLQNYERELAIPVISSKGETRRGVCILPILVGAILGVVATSLIRKISKLCSWNIDHLRRSLRHEWRKRAPSISNFYSDGEEVGSYRCKSRTPPSESFSYDEDYHHEHRDRNLSSKGLGNDAMSRALNQISKSP